ncbi:MAG: amphi-Trp domain-containing protein [Candidatus Bipolaricaulota bacterium]|nr:amphi-Trp domain-containing protein [Candidatus Bipolaricaulota bacterium]
MVELPSSEDKLGKLDYESEVSKKDLIKFLEEIVAQLKKDDKLTVSMVGAEASFPFSEPIELEVETDYNKHINARELEIEIEFREAKGTGRSPEQSS